MALYFEKNLFEFPILIIILFGGEDGPEGLQRPVHILHDLLQRLLLVPQRPNLLPEALNGGVPTLADLLHHLVHGPLQDLQRRVLRLAQSVLQPLLDIAENQLIN